MVRYKHRYFVATVAASPEQMADLGAKEIFAMLKESIAANFGDLGVGMTTPGLQVQSFDAASGVCIVRTGADSHRMVRASLSLLSGAKDSMLAVTVEGMAGCDRTLKATAMSAYARGYRRADLDDETAATSLQLRGEALDALER